jgi:hypothetical protein
MWTCFPPTNSMAAPETGRSTAPVSESGHILIVCGGPPLKVEFRVKWSLQGVLVARWRTSSLLIRAWPGAMNLHYHLPAASGRAIAYLVNHPSASMRLPSSLLAGDADVHLSCYQHSWVPYGNQSQCPISVADTFSRFW